MSYRRIGWIALVFVVAVGSWALAEPIKIAFIADIHAHDTNSPNEHKIMDDWPGRVAAFVDAANAASAAAVIDLGDLVNGCFVMGAEMGDPARIPGILDDAVAVLAGFDGPVHHVIGNHDVYDLSKEEFLVGTGQAATTYSFDLGGVHFVVLDAQYDKNGNDYGHIVWMVQGFIPQVELDWLAADLAASDLPTVVLVHQPLDADFELLAGGPSIFNNLAVRDLLAADGDVFAVFSGHDHTAHYSEIDGIHYLTIAAMVNHDGEPTPLTWAMVTIDPEARTLSIDGEGIQPDYELAF